MTEFDRNIWKHRDQELVQRSNLASPLPFWSRLKHLEEKGLIRIVDQSASTLPASVLLKA